MPMVRVETKIVNTVRCKPNKNIKPNTQQIHKITGINVIIPNENDRNSKMNKIDI